MDELLTELVKRLQEAYGTELASVILYGSGAVSDHHTKYSDLNVLCTLQRVGLEELRKGEKAFQWWIKQKQPAPVLFSVEEVGCYHEVFPIEFLDMQQSHRVLYGDDPIASIQVDRTNHRRQVEHELSSSLLRLRQRYLVLHPKEKDVARLMVESIATLATLARHALIIAGAAAPARKQEVFDAAAVRFSLDATPFQTVLKIREGTEKPSGGQIHSLFGSYLEQIAKLEDVLDHLG
jgi:hypothetical protein